MTPLGPVAFAPQIIAAARKHGLDPKLLAAVAAQETGGPGSNSGANLVGDGGHGRGIFQIDDRWHAFARTAAAMDPARNADYAAGLLKELLGRFGGNVHAALSAYNAGSGDAVGTTTVWKDGARLGYADSVLRHYSMLDGAQAGLENSAPAPSSRDPGGTWSGLLADAMRAEQLESARELRALEQYAFRATSRATSKEKSWVGI